MVFGVFLPCVALFLLFMVAEIINTLGQKCVQLWKVLYKFGALLVCVNKDESQYVFQSRFKTVFC